MVIVFFSYIRGGLAGVFLLLSLLLVRCLSASSALLSDGASIWKRKTSRSFPFYSSSRRNSGICEHLVLLSGTKCNERTFSVHKKYRRRTMLASYDSTPTIFSIVVCPSLVSFLVLLTGFDPSPKSFWSCTHVNSC